MLVKLYILAKKVSAESLQNITMDHTLESFRYTELGATRFALIVENLEEGDMMRTLGFTELTVEIRMEGLENFKKTSGVYRKYIEGDP